MESLHRSWDWLSSEPSAIAVFATAIVAFALLTAFAAAIHWSRPSAGRRFAALRPHRGGAVNLSISAADSDESQESAARRPSGSRARIRRRVSLLGRRFRRSRVLRDNLLFLSRLVTAPRQIGAVAPSSRSLGRAMAAELPKDYEYCVELGGGTGSLTRALLSAGMPRGKLIVVERDPRLAAHLRKRFRGVRVIRGEAQNLTRLLAAEGIGAVDAIVSGLPLRSLPRRVGDAIAAESFAALRPGGVYIQFTYWLQPPFTRAIAAELSIGGAVQERVWRNLPPAFVWRYQRVDGTR